MFPLCYSHHPQELINIITRVANHTTKNNQNIIHIQASHDLVCCRLIWWHCLSHLYHCKNILNFCIAAYWTAPQIIQPDQSPGIRCHVLMSREVGPGDQSTGFHASLWFCDSLIPISQPTKPHIFIPDKENPLQIFRNSKAQPKWFSALREVLPIERSVLSMKCSNKGFPFVAPTYFFKS